MVGCRWSASVFKSGSTDRLRAFTGDPDVKRLPRQHGPWTVLGLQHLTILLPTTYRAMRSRKQSLRKASLWKAFNFGACATRSEDN